MTTVWVVTGSTESGDDWRMVFAQKPTDERIIAECMADPWLRDEYEAECIQGWHVNEEPVLQ